MTGSGAKRRPEPLATWLAPPPELAISEREVHLWRAELDIGEKLGRKLQRTLPPEEQMRSRRLLFRIDRWRFVASRAFLRRILARYLRCDPAEVVLAYGKHGKPELDDDRTKTEVRGVTFNISHSDGLGLFAIARRRPIGVDVERIRPDGLHTQVVKRYFSPREAKTISELSGEQHRLAFYSCWTLKEAYLKARGQGLSFPMRHVEVTVDPGAPPAIVASGAARNDDRSWHVRRIEAGAGYAAALATPGEEPEVRFWRWEGGAVSV